MPRTDYDEVYDNAGNLVASVPREVSDAAIEREQAPALARQALTRLKQIADQGDAIAAAGSGPSQAQIRAMAAAMADMARFQRRVILALLGEA